MANSSGTGSQKFSLNGIYDPDLTGAGAQPLGYDQWAGFYQQYEVTSSVIKVHLLPPDLEAPTRFVVYPSTTSTIQSDSTAASEQPYAKTTVLNNKTLSRSNFVNSAMSVRKLGGRNTASINFTAPFGASPTLEYYWHLLLFSLNQSSIAGIYCDCELVYHCILFNRVTLNESS
jgi:hypothetical protein